MVEMRFLYRPMGDFLLWVIETYKYDVYDSSFARLTFTQAINPQETIPLPMDESVVFWGIHKKDGLIPLQVNDVPFCYSYGLDGNEYLEGEFSCDHVCGRAMRDNELTMVVGVGRERISDGTINWVINGWSDKAIPRPAMDDVEIEEED